MSSNDHNRLINAVVSYFVAPGFLASAVIALYNIATATSGGGSDQSSSDTSGGASAASSGEATQESSVLPLMSEPAPTKVMVRQSIPPSVQDQLLKQAKRNRAAPLDKDVLFVSGESEMPLSVYESPLMNAYKTFTRMEKNPESDGYYVVHRRKILPSITRSIQQEELQEGEEELYEEETLSSRGAITSRHAHSTPLNRSIDALLRNETEEDLYGDHEDSEVMLLYGRGPVFDMNNSEYYSIKADRYEGFDD